MNDRAKSPLSVDDLGFDDLFDRAEIQKIQDAFAMATGVASLITDENGRAITEPSGFCRLCADFVRTSEIGKKRCEESDAALGTPKASGPIMQRCLSAGLWDGGASITVEGRVIAKWLIGQVLDEEADLDELSAYAEVIGADKAEYRKALEEVPRMSASRFGQVSKALFLVAQQLSRLAYQNLQQSRYIANSERAQAALSASEEEFRSLFEGAPIGLLEEDFSKVKEGIDALKAKGIGDFEDYFIAHPEEVDAFIGQIRLLHVNREYRRLFRLEEAGLSLPTGVQGLPTVDRNRLEREFIAFSRGEKSYKDSISYGDADRPPLILKRLLSIPEEHAQDWSRVFVSFIDLSKEKRIEDELQNLLGEKEVLMRELEHRVKNSMNLVSSLLSLEADRIPDERTRQVFMNAQERIRSISLIYDLLAHAPSRDTLDSFEHLSELVRLLRASFLSERSDIRIELRVDSVPIDVRKAVSIGLIVNELLSNSIKYAYPEGGGRRAPRVPPRRRPPSNRRGG